MQSIRRCKSIGIIKDIGDSQEIQQDINKLQDWAKEWQMIFNYGKFKVMHFGKTNQEREYLMYTHRKRPRNQLNKRPQVG